MEGSILHWIYEEDSFRVFLLVTVLLGGGAAFLSGRAIAGTWRPRAYVLAAAALLGVVLRFFHYALFGGTFASLHYYIVDTACCVFFGLLGFQLTRARQMIRQYGFLNVPSGRFGWTRRPPAPPDGSAEAG